jgi:hypothetical protein
MTPPTIEEAKEYAKEIGVSDLEAEKFWYYFDSQDWKRANGLKLSKWRSALQVWKRNIRHDGRQTLQDARGGVFPPREARETVWSLTKRKEALEASMSALAFKSRHEGPMGSEWANAADRAKYIELREAVKKINQQIAGIP